MGMSARASLNLSSYNLTIARKITSNWAAGVGIERCVARANVVGEAEVNTILALSDGVPHEVNLPQSLAGEYKGDYYRLKVGGMHHFYNQKLGFDYFFSYPTQLKMEGSTETRLNTLKYITEDGIDLGGESLTVDNITTVESEVEREGEPFVIDLPPSLHLGGSLKVGFFSLTLNYARYFKELAFTFEDSHEAVKLTNSIHLGLDFTCLKLGGGVIFAEREGDGGDKTIIPIPSVSVGIGFPCGKRVRISSLLLAVPSPLARVSFEYKF
jgi:hypothetical protein